MSSNQNDALQMSSHPEQPLTLGAYAHTLIREQYYAVVKQEKKVLADKDPHHLHQMRVSIRRLRTALHVFDQAVKLPKAAQVKRLSKIAQTLGELRDLDVQLTTVKDKYRSQLEEVDQRSLDPVIDALKHYRKKAFAATEAMLARSRYKKFKTAYEAWIAQPEFTVLAQLPLQPLLPDLLNPLLSTLLLHPGWLVPSTDLSEAANLTLHDLRKACKHVRYQAEFFVSFYGEAFKDWIDEVKKIQANLGEVHDSQVLLEVLTDELASPKKLANLQKTVRQTQIEMMSDWEPTRQHYLDPAFRHQLYHMLLEPTALQDVPQTPAAVLT